MLGSAFNHDMVDEPALETSPPAPDIDFDAVFLNVGTRRQEEFKIGTSGKAQSQCYEQVREFPLQGGAV